MNDNRGRRHGDVLLRPVDAKAEGLDFDKAKSVEELTLALGEATGHHHTLYPVTEKSGVRMLEINGRRFVDVGAEYFLRHQEHKEHRIDPGTYEIIIEEEYDPFEEEMKKVID